MEQWELERRRAVNMVWNGAEDYDFQPDVLAYDETGQAELYLNSILGILHRQYDWKVLSEVLDSVRGPEQESGRALLWLGLERCAYLREKGTRPALEELRQDYARRQLARSRDWRDQKLVERIESAWYARALGQEAKLGQRERQLLEALEFDPAGDTQKLAEQAKTFLKTYFQLNEGREEQSHLHLPVIFSKGANAYLGPLRELRDMGFGSAKDRRGAPTGQEKKRRSWLQERRRRNQEKLRQYIEGSFGLPVCTPERQRELEQALCTGNHAECHLHFTRGDFGPVQTEKSQEVQTQQHKNEDYYQQRRNQHENTILRLSERIRNALLVYHEPEIVRTSAGQLAAGRVWRGIHLNDRRIFTKIHQDDPGDLSVDILLDSSSSQLENQEQVAAQGYMIAEALTRCDVPTRVYSFCSVSGYTVVKLFRDYGESGGNRNIFRYFSAGWNRDGLAIRVARHMLEQSDCAHRLLILLSDVNPNDDGKFPASGALHVGQDYGGKAGVEDTAQEVRLTRLAGVSVLCVFTGKDDDVENAKTIYGQDFARIKNVDQFADTVGGLIQRQIREMA